MNKDEFIKKTSYLLWDMNLDTIDADINRRIIIERIFTIGDFP